MLSGSHGKASVYNAGNPGSSPGLGRSLEKEMAIHSSTIAWKIPWTEEPGRLQSMGSQRVGLDWATSLSLSNAVTSSGTWANPFTFLGFLGEVLVVKNPPANAGNKREVGLIPGSRRSPGGGHGNSLQYSCLENPMDRGAWRATVHGVAKSQTRQQLNNNNIYILEYPFLVQVYSSQKYQTLCQFHLRESRTHGSHRMGFGGGAWPSAHRQAPLPSVL